MKLLKFLCVCCLSPWLFRLVRANDFSSFLTANASLAVMVDQEYMLRRGENILANFQKILGDIIRENLKNGGINVRYFSWSQVRLKKDFIAAMTVTDCKSTWRFYEEARITSILLIAITDANCPRLPQDRALMIPIVEEGQTFSQIIFDVKVQQILKWKTAVLLVDQSILNDNPLLVESVVHESTKNHITPFSMLLYQMNDTLRSQKKRAAIRETLTQLQDTSHSARQFIVVSKFYEDIIEVAASMDMFHIYNQWLYILLDEVRREFDPLTVTQNLEEGANIAFILNSTNSDCQSSINCTISEISFAFVTSISRVILEEQSIYGEISDEEWESIRFTKQEKQQEILGYMKEYLATKSVCSSCAHWSAVTAITWGKSEEQRTHRPGMEYRDSRNKYFEFINVGFWTPVLGFRTHEVMFPHNRHFFRNITMDVLTTHSPPWQILEHDSRGHIVKHTGIVMEILKELSRMLNFTYNLHEVKNGAYLDSDDGADANNETDSLMGSLTFKIPPDMVTKLQSNRFLIAALAVTIDEPDKKPFNYTLPISVQRYTFIARKPDEVSRVYLFTAPFTLETWGCLVGIILITAPALCFINRFAALTHLRTEGLYALKNCFWYIYGALLQQGGMYLPKSDSGRLVIGVWWIVVIVLVTTYCGNLVAFLTFPQFEPGVAYFFRLFDSNDIQQFGLRNDTYFEKYAMLSTRSDFREYVQRAIMYNNSQTEDIAAVERGKRVNVDWRINLQLLIQKEFEKDKECKYMLGRESFLDEQIGLIVPTDSPYLQLINEHLTRMFQMGFIERWHQINLPSMDKCSGRGVFRQITNHKVNLDDMQGCFMVLVLGFGWAMFIVLIEYSYHRWVVVAKQKKTFSS